MSTRPPDDAPDARSAPRDADAVRPVLIGTVLWVVAGLVLLTQLDSLRDEGRGWWVAACGAGALLGLIGCWVVLRRRAAYRRAGRDAG